MNGNVGGIFKGEAKLPNLLRHERILTNEETAKILAAVKMIANHR